MEREAVEASGVNCRKPDPTVEIRHPKRSAAWRYEDEFLRAG
jgi:hypothetical protein